MIRCAFTNAICAFAPQARVTRRCETDWCSARFVGKRLVLDLLWRGTDAALQSFLEQLPDHEFMLPTMFVADIIATRNTQIDGYASLTIEALLFADET